MLFRSVLRRLIAIGRKPSDDFSKDDFRTMLEQSADVICHIADGCFLYISPSAVHVFGWDRQYLIGKEAMMLVYEDDRPAIQDIVNRLLSGQEYPPSVQCRHICGDGSLKWCETSASVERDDSGAHRGVLVMRDISARKQLEIDLAVLSYQDSLTGLGNRRSFDQALDLEWEQTIREGGEMALLLLDLDHFKQFNDCYGHQAGDDCLRAVAACVQQHVRNTRNVACRYGGEEIAVILGATSADAALKSAEALCSSIIALSIPHQHNSCGNYVTASIGVATAIARLGGSIRMPESLLQAADHALYKAKAAGRGRVEQSLLIVPSA